jgi:hypothetical protein
LSEACTFDGIVRRPPADYNGAALNFAWEKSTFRKLSSFSVNTDPPLFLTSHPAQYIIWKGILPEEFKI